MSLESEDEINGGYLVDPERNTPTSLKKLRIGSFLSNRMKRVSTIKPEYDKVDEKNAAFFFNRWRKRSKTQTKCKKLITKFFKDKELRGELDHRFRPWIHQDQMKSYFNPALIRARSRICYKRRNFLILKRNYKMINSLRKVLYQKKLDCFLRWKRRSKWPKVLPFHLLKAFQRFKLKINQATKRNNIHQTSFDTAIEAKNIYKKMSKFNGITAYRALYIMNVTALHRKAQWYAVRLFASKIIKKFQKWIQKRMSLRRKIANKMTIQRVTRRKGGFSPYKMTVATRMMTSFHAFTSRMKIERIGNNKAFIHWGSHNFKEMYRILMVWKKNRNDVYTINMNYHIKIGKNGLVNMKYRVKKLKRMWLAGDKGERHHREKRLREAIFTLLDHCTETRANKETVMTPASPTKYGAFIISVSDLTTNRVKMHETAEAGVLLMAHGIRRTRALRRGFRIWHCFFQRHKRNRESNEAGSRLRLVALIRRWRFLSTSSGIGGHVHDVHDVNGMIKDERAISPVISLERFLESSNLVRKQKEKEKTKEKEEYWCPTGVHLPVYRRRDRMRSQLLAETTRTTFWLRQWQAFAQKSQRCNLHFKQSLRHNFLHKCRNYIHTWQRRIRTRGLDRFIIPIQDSLATRLLLPRVVQDWRRNTYALKNARITLEVADVRAFTIISHSTIGRWLRWTGRRSLLHHKHDAFKAVHHPSYPSLCRCVSQFSRTARNILLAWYEWCVPRRSARIAAFHVRGIVNMYRVTRCMDTLLNSYERQVVRSHSLKRSLSRLSWLRSLSEDEFMLLKYQLRRSLNIKAGYSISPEEEEEKEVVGGGEKDIDLKIPLINGFYSYHWVVQLVVSDRTRTLRSLQRRSMLSQRMQRWKQLVQRTRHLRRLEARVAKWRHFRPDYCIGWTFWRWRSSWAALVTQRGFERYKELQFICGPIIRKWKQWVYRMKVRGGATGYKYRSSRAIKTIWNRTSSSSASISASVGIQSSHHFNTAVLGGLGMAMSKAHPPLSPIPVQMKDADDSYDLSFAHLYVNDGTIAPLSPLHMELLEAPSPSRHSISIQESIESRLKYTISLPPPMPHGRNSINNGKKTNRPPLPAEVSGTKGSQSKTKVRRCRKTNSSTANTNTNTNTTATIVTERSGNMALTMVATVDAGNMRDRGYEGIHQSRRWFESTL